MTKRMWIKLVRESKNNNTYFRLITCIKGYLKYWNKFSLIEFYSQYAPKDIREWYLDEWIFNRGYEIVYKKV